MAARTHGPSLRVYSPGHTPDDVQVTLDGQPLEVEAVTVHMELDQRNSAMVKLSVDQAPDVRADQVTWVGLEAVPTKVLEAELHDRADRDRPDPELVPWSLAVHERMTAHRIKEELDPEVLLVSWTAFDLLDTLGVQWVWGLHYTTDVGLAASSTDARDVLDVRDLELDADEAARLRLGSA